jgi:hypothetical protein
MHGSLKKAEILSPARIVCELRLMSSGPRDNSHSTEWRPNFDQGSTARWQPTLPPFGVSQTRRRNVCFGVIFVHRKLNASKWKGRIVLLHPWDIQACTILVASVHQGLLQIGNRLGAEFEVKVALLQAAMPSCDIKLPSTSDGFTSTPSRRTTWTDVTFHSRHNTN